MFGFAYPAVMTGFAQVAFADKANGSLITHGRQGRRLAARRAGVHEPALLPPAPVGDGAAYNAGATTFANLGPTNPDLAKNVQAAARGDPEARAARTTRA